MTAPTRIYSYGCLAPVGGLGVIDEQLYRAHRYRNELVDIEARHREGIARVQRDHEQLGPLLDAIHMAETHVAEGRRQIRALDTGGTADRARSKPERDAVAEMVEAAKGDLAVLRTLRALAKALLTVHDKSPYELVREAWVTSAKDPTCYGSPHLTAYVRPWQRIGQAVHAAMTGHPGERLECEYAIVSDTRDYEIRQARAASGLSSGTYLQVEAAMEASIARNGKPRKLRYDGSGRLAVQLTGGGMTRIELESGEDPRLALLPATPTVSRGGSRVQAKVPANARTVRIRVAPGKQTALLPVLIDRPIPDDARITWAWMLRRRHGVRYRYHLQLVMTAESWAPPRRADRGVLAIDIGARDLPDGRTRVAYWLDGDGRRGEVTNQLTRLSSPTHHSNRRVVPDALDKVRDLQAIRSRHLDQIKEQLTLCRKASPSLPPEMQERMTAVHAWRSPARIALLLRHWVRHEGDGQIREAITAYLDHDRHLLDWQVNEQRRHDARARARYDEFAAWAATSYSTIVIADRSYVRETQVPEEGLSTQGHESRVIMRHAAPGELKERVRRAATKYGSRVVTIALDGDTAWALDWKVCERLLASADVLRGQAHPIAGARTETAGKTRKVGKRRRLGTEERVDPLAAQDVSSRVIR
jgi:hypothetical protein